MMMDWIFENIPLVTEFTLVDYIYFGTGLLMEYWYTICLFSYRMYNMYIRVGIGCRFFSHVLR